MSRLLMTGLLGFEVAVEEDIFSYAQLFMASMIVVVDSEIMHVLVPN